MGAYGCRSKFSTLPHRVRWHVYDLLLDGATFKTLSDDPVFSEALDRAGITFNDTNLKFVRRSREFTEFARMRRKFLETKYQDMMLSSVIKKSGALENLTDQARCKLLEALSELSGLLASEKQGEDGSEVDRIKALRSLAQSLASLSNPVRENRIADLRRRLREKVARWKIREDELLARIAELEGSNKAAAGMSRETLAEVEDRIRLL